MKRRNGKKQQDDEQEEEGNKISFFEYKGVMVFTFEGMPLSKETFQSKSEMKTRMAHWSEKYAEFGELVINIIFDEQQ